MMMPEDKTLELQKIVADLGDRMTPFFYLFIAVPQYDSMIQQVYEWVYESFGDSNHPDKTLDAIRHLKCCADHIEQIKEHLVEVMVALRHTSMGESIEANKKAVSDLMDKLHADGGCSCGKQHSN
jgi:hypothetical protein